MTSTRDGWPHISSTRNPTCCRPSVHPDFPAVLTLWPPQRELLTRPAANPLHPATDRLLISVPTSAGKSLLSQLIMCTHLATVPVLRSPRPTGRDHSTNKIHFRNRPY